MTEEKPQDFDEQSNQDPRPTTQETHDQQQTELERERNERRERLGHYKPGTDDPKDF